MISKLKSLKDHQGFMKYFKNTSWLFAEKILRMIVGFIVGIWVARYLGPEQFGLFSYAQSFVGLFAVIATLGLDGIVVRELVKDKSQRDVLIGTAFWLKVMGASGVLSILAIAVNFTSNDTFTNILVFIIASATIFQSFNVIDFYFQSKVLSKYIVYANIISLLLSSIVKVMLILNKAPLIAFAWVVLFDSFILASGLVYFYIRQHSTFKIKNLTFNKVVATKLLKDSWPLILGGIVYVTYTKIDQIMIQYMLGSQDVGYYAVAVRLRDIWYFLPSIIATSIFPAIINAKKNNLLLYEQRLQNLYNFMVWLSIFISIFIFYFREEIIILLFGEVYQQSSIVLGILIWSSIFLFFGIARSKWIVAENLQKYTIIMHTFGAFFNIILNFIFIKSYGIAGAAVSSVFSYFLSLILIPYFITKLRISIKMFFISIMYPIRKVL